MLAAGSMKELLRFTKTKYLIRIKLAFMRKFLP